MGYEKARKSSHQNPQFTPEPKTVQPKPYSQEAANRQDIENQSMREYKHEATTLEIQAKYGTITPQGQERLTFLQAKMADYTQRKLDFGNRVYQHMFNSSGGDVSVTPPERKTVAPIQAKLTIGQPGDKYEQEADQVAAQIVNQIHAPDAQRQEIPEEELQMKPEIGSIQRETISNEDKELQMKSGGAEMTAPQDLETSIQQAKGSGQSLADSIKEPMEQAFGVDFSSVKVHTDTRSNQLNQLIQARAFTTGQDIFFRQGEYNPGSRGGQELLAHELTHVVQQNSNHLSRQALLSHTFDVSSAPEPTIQCTKFSSPTSLNNHYQKHVVNQNDAGSAYADESAYEQAAINIVNDSNSLVKSGASGKTYYLNSTTGQFVATNTSGDILTMFVPASNPLAYFNKQK